MKSSLYAASTFHREKLTWGFMSSNGKQKKCQLEQWIRKKFKQWKTKKYVKHVSELISDFLLGVSSNVGIP